MAIKTADLRIEFNTQSFTKSIVTTPFRIVSQTSLRKIESALKEKLLHKKF